MKPKKTIYISIPLKCCETWSINEAQKAKKHYEKLGFKVYNPNDLLDQFRKTLCCEPTEFQQLTYTLKYLSTADIMVLFPEYPRSFRCTTEIALANKFKIPIIRVYSGGMLPASSTISNIFNTLQEPSDILLISNIMVN